MTLVISMQIQPCFLLSHFFLLFSQDHWGPLQPWAWWWAGHPSLCSLPEQRSAVINPNTAKPLTSCSCCCCCCCFWLAHVNQYTISWWDKINEHVVPSLKEEERPLGIFNWLPEEAFIYVFSCAQLCPFLLLLLFSFFPFFFFSRTLSFPGN